MSDLPGAWIVTLTDWNEIPKALFDNELDARRWDDNNGGYHDVTFWPFGVAWDAITVGSSDG